MKRDTHFDDSEGKALWEFDLVRVDGFDELFTVLFLQNSPCLISDTYVLPLEKYSDRCLMIGVGEVLK